MANLHLIITHLTRPLCTAGHVTTHFDLKRQHLGTEGIVLTLTRHVQAVHDVRNRPFHLTGHSQFLTANVQQVGVELLVVVKDVREQHTKIGMETGTMQESVSHVQQANSRTQVVQRAFVE